MSGKVCHGTAHLRALPLLRIGKLKVEGSWNSELTKKQPPCIVLAHRFQPDNPVGRQGGIDQSLQIVSGDHRTLPFFQLVECQSREALPDEALPELRVLRGGDLSKLAAAALDGRGRNLVIHFRSSCSGAVAVGENMQV